MYSPCPNFRLQAPKKIGWPSSWRTIYGQGSGNLKPHRGKRHRKLENDWKNGDYLASEPLTAAVW